MSLRPVALKPRGSALILVAPLFSAALSVTAARAVPAPPAPAAAPAPPPAKAAPPAPSKATAPVPSRSQAPVVARVNGSPILRREFEMAVQIRFRQRGPGQRRHEDLQAVRDSVLESLIDNELLYQKAVQAKTEVSEAEIKADLGRLKSSLGTPDEVTAFLTQNGVTEKDLSDEVRRALLVGRFADKQVADSITVPESAQRAYYSAHPDRFTRPEAVRIRQIVVRVPSNATLAARAGTRRKIEEILKEIKGGQDFAEAARRYSEGVEAQRGGDSGWVWPGGGALPPVERAAMTLQPGQTSDIVESRRGYHIIKAVERRPAGTIPFEEARERIAARLQAEQRDQRIRAYVAELRKSARIEKTL